MIIRGFRAVVDRLETAFPKSLFGWVGQNRADRRLEMQKTYVKPPIGVREADGLVVSPGFYAAGA